MICTINMLNKSDKIKGQGVTSASEEAINLIKNGFGKEYKIFENEKVYANITHIHSINLGFFLKIRNLKKHGKVVGSVHFLPETLENSIYLPKFFKRLFYIYVLKMYKNMDYLVTVNPCFVQKLKEYGVDESKISYVPNFVDEKRFFSLDFKTKKALREKYKIRKDSFTVLCVGQLQKRKGIFDFLEIAKKLNDFEFVWAGGFSFGAISDGYVEIKKMVKNPPKNVHFLGIINREYMNEVYNIADVMFLPSFEELFPMALLEAMSCGVPILVRDIKVYEDILFNFYLKGNNVIDFVNILNRLAKDRDFYSKARDMSVSGHKFYSSEHVLKMWQDFYKKIIAS